MDTAKKGVNRSPSIDPTDEVERPLQDGRKAQSARYGSDLIAETLRALELRYIALNPGASYRGLHDSIVNHLGNLDPRILLCLHEEHAVAIAHGYAKVTGRPMAAMVHSNVGLMHASMAVFNAWCDRVPLMLLGATGPVDAARRRPWIDWIHTSQDQGALVRDYVKWDDQPASVEAAVESLFRGHQLACTAPRGPVYVNFDADIQERELSDEQQVRDSRRFAAPDSGGIDEAQLETLVTLLKGARRPVLLVGRVSRDPTQWRLRVALAEALDARVATDLKVGAGFPSDHRLHISHPGLFPNEETLAALREADVILSLDWLDLGGLLKQAFGRTEPQAKILSVSLDHHLHRGWSKDHQALAPVDLAIQTEPDRLVTVLAVHFGVTASVAAGAPPALPSPPSAQSDEEPTIRELSQILRARLSGREVCLARLPLGWPGDAWPFHHPLDYLGYDGGGGVGSGPGMAVGAALALKDTSRLAVAVLGDGDFLMGCTAIWTAVRYGIPLMVVVANNRSFFNDEIHQERVAKLRNRPVENRWIGQRIDGPAPDIAKFAEAQGATGYGPARSGVALDEMLRRALADLEAGRVAVVDAHVQPGYDHATAAATVRSGSAASKTTGNAGVGR